MMFNSLDKDFKLITRAT